MGKKSKAKKKDKTSGKLFWGDFKENLKPSFILKKMKKMLKGT